MENSRRKFLKSSTAGGLVSGLSVGSFSLNSSAEEFDSSECVVANVRDYGAVGDGSRPDTKAFKDALSASRNIYIPEGEYWIEDTLKPKDGTVIKGAGIELSKIRMETSEDIDLMVIGWRCYLSDFTMRQNSSAEGGQRGVLRMQSFTNPDIPEDWRTESVGGLSYRNTLRNISCQRGQNYSIYLVNGAYNLFDNVKAVLARGGSGNLHVNGSGGNPETTTLTIIKGEFIASTGGPGVKLINTHSSHVYGAVMEGNRDRGLLVQECGNIHFQDIYLENNFAVNLGSPQEGGDGDIVIIDSDSIHIQNPRIVSNNSKNSVSSFNTTNSALIGGSINKLGGSVATVNIPGWQYSISPTSIYDNGFLNKDSYTRYADGTILMTLNRSYKNITISSASGAMWVSGDEFTITDFPKDLVVNSDLSKKMSYSVHVLTENGEFIWPISSGSSKLNNAIRFRLMSSILHSNIDVDIQIVVTGRCR